MKKLMLLPLLLAGCALTPEQQDNLRFTGNAIAQSVNQAVEQSEQQQLLQEQIRTQRALQYNLTRPQFQPLPPLGGPRVIIY